MPPKERTNNHQSFNRCVRKLSDAIGFEQTEKLSEFMRRTIQFLLGESPISTKKSKKTASEGEMTFQKHPGAFLLSEFELDFFCKTKKKDLTPMATVKFRDGYYRGLPDQHPTIEQIEDLPPLVRRRLIYAEAVRNGAGHSEWSQIRHNGKGYLKLDFQLNGIRKRKKSPVYQKLKT